MKTSVYVETSVIGYLTSWPRQDTVVAGHQKTTKQWWLTAADTFELYVSQLVIHECSQGDPNAIADRLEVVKDISTLPLIPAATTLAQSLIDGKAVPENQPNDALHIAIAAVHHVK